MEAPAHKYIDMLLEGGAFVAKEVSPTDVVTAPWPIMKCLYGCPRYGHNRCCPPFTPDWQRTRAILDSFSRAILFGTRDMATGTPLALKVQRAMLRDGLYKAIAYGTGPCTRCERCTPDACPCPAETAPSMEACGIDVIATVRAAGLEINPAPASGEPLACYGLLLVD